MVRWNWTDINLVTLYHLFHLCLILICWSIVIHLARNPLSRTMLRHHHKTSYPCGEDVFLNLDQACLSLSAPDRNIDFFAQSTECVDCPYWKIWSGSPISNRTFIPVNATWSTQMRVNAGQEILCQMEYHFQEFGRYELSIVNDTRCHMNLHNDPGNSALPILYAFLLLTFLKGAWTLYRNLRKSRQVRIYFSRFRTGAALPEVQNDLADDNQLLLSPNAAGNSNMNPEQAPSAPTPAEATLPRPKKPRIRSLDAFRGFSLAIMIFVNYGGGAFWFFAHSRWNGLTVADLVFPWFMWIMGVSLVIGMQAQVIKNVPRKKIFIKIVKRSAILFLLGLFINSHGKNDFATLRIPGVLQRFSFAFCAAAVLEASLMKREPLSNHPGTWWAPIRDIRHSHFQWLFMLFIVSIHTGVTFLLNVPGCPTGYLGPGGLHDQAKNPNCTGGAARYVDVLFFGSQHIYQNPTPKKIYDTHVPFDPEGLLGSFTSLFLVFLGVQAGKILLAFPGWQERMKRFWIWAFILGSLAGLLCDFAKEGGMIPVNKNLWSLSFVLALGSMAYFLFSLM